MNDAAAHLEIERVFLLRRLPDLPRHAERLRIQQGYLPERSSPGQLEGRIRRVQREDGSIACVLTIKRGLGRVRQEFEQPIDLAVFDREWPRTARQRIAKTRWRIREGDLVWEIDAFDAPAGLVLAEVELVHPDQPVEFPPWLAPLIEKEVTDDVSYTNRSIARRLGGLE